MIEVTAATGGVDILAPLGMIEVSVALILKRLNEGSQPRAHFLGKNVDPAVAVTLEKTGVKEHGERLIGALAIGQEADVVASGVGVIESAGFGIVEVIEPFCPLGSVVGVEALQGFGTFIIEGCLDLIPALCKFGEISGDR